MFHIKLDFVCKISNTTVTLTQFLSQTPANESVAIQITDASNAKTYSFQALHALPFANVASQLAQNGAGDGQFLKWSNSAKGWVPGTVSGATGGTVTEVFVSAPLAVSTATSTPSITLPQASGTQSGYLSSADWTTFNNKEGTIAGGTAAQYYRGDKSWQTLDTLTVPENVNLYFTNARALGVPLTGFSATSNAIVATDTVIEGFSKAQGQINTLSSDAAHFLKKDNTDSITGTVNVGVTGSLTITNAPALPTDAANRQYVNTYADTKLALTGGTLSGALNLDSDLKIKGGSNYVTVRGHGTSAAYNFILPQTAGTSGYVLQTDGTGNLSWINPSSVTAGSGTVNSVSITDGSIVDADINASAAIAQSKIANLTSDLAAKVSTTLTSGNILVGSAGNVASPVAVSGDATLSNAGVLTLANTGTAGTYKSVTVDAKGRVTVGTNPTTLAGYGITDTLVTGVSVTAPLTNAGTATVPLIGMPVATASANGYLSSGDFTTFNNKQDAINAATTLNIGSLFSNLQAGLVLNPHSAAAGGTGELRFKELAPGGSNYVGFKAPDALAGNIIYTLPPADGSNGQALTTNSTGGLSWTTVATSSSNLTGDIGGTIGANTIGAGKVTLTHLSATGTKDNTTYLRGDNTFSSLATDVRAVTLTGLSTATNAVITAADSVLSSLGKLQKQISDFAVSAVGGDLSGNLPNPTVVKIQGRAVTNTAPLAGQVLKYNTGTPAWEPSYVLVGDLKSSALGNLFPGTGCAANQTLYYSVVGDAFTCVNIDSLDAGKITTGTIAAARLPSSATYWQAATGGINYAGGSVGIGTTSPNQSLHTTASAQIGGRAYVTGDTGNSMNVPTLVMRYDTTNNYGEIFARDYSSATQKNLIFQSGGGNVGIGTISPLSKLHLSGLALGDEALRISSNASNARLIVGNKSDGTGYDLNIAQDTDGSANKNFTISTGGVEKLRINAAGNVGIGTTNPQYRFEVQKDFSGLQNVTAAFIGGTDSGYTNTGLYVLQKDNTGFNSNATYLINAVLNGTSKMVVTGLGNVGVGTTSPTAKLHLTDPTTSVVSRIDSVAAGTSAQLNINSAAAGYPHILFTQGGVGRFEIGQVASNGNFYFNNNTQVGEANAAMVISKSGAVGIGTIGPTHKLDVNGDIQIVNASNGSKFYSSRSDSDYDIIQSTTSTKRAFTIHPSASGADVFSAYAHNGTTFIPGLHVKNTTGNVGIGMTNPYTKLHVSGSIGSTDWVGAGCETSCSDVASGYAIMYANGTGVATSGWTTTSDIRLKENIVPIENALEKILSLDGYMYNYIGKPASEKQIGVIAQEVQKKFPEVVLDNKETGFLSVDYPRLVAPLIVSIKEFYHKWNADSRHKERKLASIEKSLAEKNRKIQKLESENQQMKLYLCSKDPQATFCN